jgi:hypothetical protein
MTSRIREAYEQNSRIGTESLAQRIHQFVNADNSRIMIIRNDYDYYLHQNANMFQWILKFN